MNLFLDIFSIVNIFVMFLLYVVWSKDTRLNLTIKLIFAFMTVGAVISAIHNFNLQIVAL